MPSNACIFFSFAINILTQRSISQVSTFLKTDSILSESCSVVSDSVTHGLHSPWNSPGQDTGVGSLSLLQGTSPTEGLNPGLPYCRQILYQLSHKGSPRILEWVDYPFSRASSLPRNRTRVSCIARGFFINWVMREARFYLSQPVIQFSMSPREYTTILSTDKNERTSIT